MELGRCFHDDALHRMRSEPSLQSPPTTGIVRNREPLVERVKMDIQSIFTNVDADIDFWHRAGFGHYLSLHTGRAPFHLFRTARTADRPSSLSVLITQARTVQSAKRRGVATPRRLLHRLVEEAGREYARRERLRVSTKTPRPQERRVRGTERVLRKLPLNFQVLPIVTRMGRDYRPGPFS